MTTRIGTSRHAASANATPRAALTESKAAPQSFTRASSAVQALWVLVAVAGVFLLRESGELLIPIVLAVLVSYALEPLVAWLQRRGLPRTFGAGLLLVAILGFGGWSAYGLRHEVNQAFEGLPDAARQAREMIWSQMQSGPGQQVQEAVSELQQPPPAADGSPTSPPAQTAAPVAGNGLLGEWVQFGLGSAIAFAGQVTVIVFLVYFLLISGGHFKRRLVDAAGPDEHDRLTTSQIVDDINRQIQRFLVVQCITALAVAAATWAVLAWMGVRQALVWAVVAGVFNSVPYFGPLVVSGGLFIITLMQFGAAMPAVKVAAAALTITSLEGWLLNPALMGRAEHMHTVVVFLGVLVWTWIWGAWGTILAVPMLVVFKAIADHVAALKPVSRLMSP